MSTSKHLRISGRVQGVGFRMYMQQRADELGVTGWVRNRRDGTVESVVQGTPEAVKAIIAWAHKGPPSAVVTDVEVTDAGPEMFPGFTAQPTG